MHGISRIRRLLLIGRLDEAEHRLAELDASGAIATRGPGAAHQERASGALAARVEGRPRAWLSRGSRFERLRTKTARAALRRAERAARDAGIPALTAEVESASLVLSTPRRA